MSRQIPKTLCGWRGVLTRVISIQKTRAHEFSDTLNELCGDGVDLLWIRIAMSASHADIARATAILFPSQMAILRGHHHI